ncbi:undecaprenyldiphospho-muramoylpentapeptide beta-N-acetylglucosaminyltransferase [Eudoraea chungangensis]|uniref:undecaprenyldiphospho-muramoylpentapeptide beta-N-acetylglucosaminyltransferase n=1 Tax=Eudoraea chungangensis TaxID=1481905 RepID=UPI0023EC64CF
MANYKFILSGGGTGGHIYPAIAIADELKRRFPDADFLFVGAKDKMEMEKVPQAGYEIKGLWISGLQRSLTLKNALFPIKLISSLIDASKIVRKFKPNVVIGTGGFASGPVLKIASATSIPCVVQEQNSYAGITNKLLAKKAACICVAYDHMERFFPREKLVKTGNPVRRDLTEKLPPKEEALQEFGLAQDKITLLVLGGSLGAQSINELIRQKIGFLEERNVQLIWQCGSRYFDTYQEYQSSNVKIRSYLNNMNYSFSAADIVISRAGASSVSELCLVGKPVIFIPSPNVAEDHQTKNAMSLVGEEAAVMIAEKDLESAFDKSFDQLLRDKSLRERLGKNIKNMALPNATKDIVNQIIKLL